MELANLRHTKQVINSSYLHGILVEVVLQHLAHRLHGGLLWQRDFLRDGARGDPHDAMRVLAEVLHALLGHALLRHARLLGVTSRICVLQQYEVKPKKEYRTRDEKHQGCSEIRSNSIP